MLTRAVRRRQNLRLTQHAATQIQLPWLCPALWSSHTTYTLSRSNQRPIACRDLTGRRCSAAYLSTNTRKLASAGPTPGILDSKDTYLPFSFSNPPLSSTTSSPSLPSLAPDLSKILKIDQTTAVGPEILESGRNRDFIRGNAWEVEATLDACLQVHRWDRAMKILHQLQCIYVNNPEQLQRLYNKMLEAMVFDHIWNRSSDNIGRINGWVENYMKKGGVCPNAQTFALKIKAAMATLQGRRRDRTVRRYWDMAKEYNVDWEVASLRGILSDSDLGKLSEISPLEPDVNSTEEIGLEESHLAVQDDIVSRPALPSVRETNQKGLGLSSLKQSLSLFNDPSHLAEWENLKHVDTETREAYAQQRQLQLEQNSLDIATERWKIEHQKMTKMGIAGDLSHGKIGALLWSWHEQLTTSIKEELQQVADAETSTKLTAEQRLKTEYGPFLQLLDPQHLAALTATSIILIMTKFGIDRPIKLASLVVDLGRTVEHEVDAQLKKQRDVLKKARASARGSSTTVTDTLRDERNTDVGNTPSRMHWSIAQLGKVGSILCELFFNVAKLRVKLDGTDAPSKVIVEQAAFERKNTYHQGKRLGVVSMHNDLITLLSKEPVADIIAKQLPMICKPKSWTGFDEGGYLEAKNNVLRIKNIDAIQKEYAQAAAERGDLDQLFKGLDVLGQTGWRINQDVFSVMVEAWNSGEAIANLPPVEKVFADLPELADDASPREKYHHYKNLQAIQNEKGGLHSNRCFQNFQMEIARAYTNDTFYLPHNVDFRGRAYPIPPYLNQMGADNARGLMLFAKGRELGKHGLKWLKVHLANVCGYDKASLTDRANYADSHIDDIRDSVENPLSGNRWWLRAEDPWQCLATCNELIKAIDSGDTEKFVSHLPIHQDGTCNGLQHYAALGGDIAGARQVNLEPGDKPADVYTGVAELVKAEIKMDAEAGDKLAKELDGRITRKIVKQTVMTNVYGVTFTGARLQVRKQLDDLLPDLNEKKLASVASTYIARKIFKGLGTLFEGAHDIQYWFGDCASRISNSISPAQLEEISSVASRKNLKRIDRRISRDLPLPERKSIDQGDFRSTVVWTTPIKLPVVQPYRVSRAQTIKTHMASIMLTEPNVTDSIDKRKQLQGFPPNFIHSLDATHMILSALKAQELGLTFSAVHDSFWTHAADIDQLNTLLRDAFIRMHTEDIVGRLAEEFKLRYQGHLYLARIGSNNPLAKKILEWRAKTKQAELETTSAKKGKQGAAEKRRRYWEISQEAKRQRLLASHDPKEVAKGQKMVTPASLFEALDGEQYIKVRNSLGETALGKVPESRENPEIEVMEEALHNDVVEDAHDVDLVSTLQPVLETNPVEEEKAADEDLFLTMKTRKPSKENLARNTVWLWLPLTFKPVPKKGDWDVRRLKESVYFFS